MNQKVFVLVLSLIAASSLYYSSFEKKDDFNEWKQRFGVVFAEEEEAFRKIIYLKNIEMIDKHNADDRHTYKMGVNQFTALTD